MAKAIKFHRDAVGRFAVIPAKQKKKTIKKADGWRIRKK